MRKITFDNEKGQKLAGIIHESTSRKIVIMAHGLLLSKDNLFFAKIGEKFVEENISFLRFDFSGCGESDWDLISPTRQVLDLKSAIEYSKSLGYEKFAVIGESFGGYCALKLNHLEIKTIVLWAPLSNSRPHPLWLESEKKIRKQGFIEKEKDGKNYRISIYFFTETNFINQKLLASEIGAKVLIIHGDSDNTIPLRDSKNLLNHLPEGSNLEVISGADHILKDNKTMELTVNWIKERL